MGLLALALEVAIVMGSGAAAAQLHFVDATAAMGLDRWTPTFGAVLVDLDRDGDDDLVISRHGDGPALYLNDGFGGFTDATWRLGRTHGDRHGIVAADLDNDGDRDLVIAGGGADGVGTGAPNFLLVNLLADTGELRFVERTVGTGLDVDTRYRGRALLPVASEDGARLDLHLECVRRAGFPNELLRSVAGAAGPRYVSDRSSGLSFEAASEGLDTFVDLDGDHRPELLLNDGGRLRLFTAVGSGWVEVPDRVPSLNRVSCVAVGDLDSDGDPDVFVGSGLPPTGSDHARGDNRTLVFVVRAHVDGDRDDLELHTTSDRLVLDLGFKAGVGGPGLDRIHLGPRGDHPGSTAFEVVSGEIAGSPPQPLPEGVSVWFEPDRGRWRVAMQHGTAGVAEMRGTATTPGGLTSVSVGFESFPPSAPAEDRLLRNDGGRLVPWPDGPRLEHALTTAACRMADLDNNGEPDLVLLRRDEPGAGSGEPVVMLNRGGRLEVVADTGLDIPEDDLFRADQLITSDLDVDGRLDLVMTHGFGLKPDNQGPWRAFLNRTASAGHFVRLELEGTRSNRDAIGARVSLFAADGRRLGDQQLGAGFHRSQPSHVLHFGVGADAGPATAVVIWPSGLVSQHVVEPDRLSRLVEPLPAPRAGVSRLRPSP